MEAVESTVGIRRLGSGLDFTRDLEWLLSPV